MKIGIVLLGTALVGIAALTTGCSDPPPQCAARGESYQVCSGDQIWTCPEGDAETVDYNLKIDEECNKQADPTECILNAEYKMIEMTPSTDCAAADEVCIEDVSAAGQSASCEKP